MPAASQNERIPGKMPGMQIVRTGSHTMRPPVDLFLGAQWLLENLARMAGIAI